MREGPRRTSRARWIVALFAAVFLVCGLAPVRAWAADGAVYVSASGSDETGDGTQSNPYATLRKGVEEAESGDTVYVMSNLTMQACARYYGKHLTITSGEGGPYTLTRGDDFAEHQDSARSTYNPAMIEVDSTDGPNTASLVLTNIIIDDAAKHEGSYFVQADSEGDGHTTVGSTEVGNTDIVQDGIIATYNGVATITLGDGAILKNYGGMCAVRISGGELIMEDGSQIIDDYEIAREKGAKGSFGPAGAIWLQGGTLTMNGGIIGGAEGTTMTGRAVYADSGTANIGGTIQNIKGADAAWQGQNGVAVHLRSGAEATLTETGTITNVTGANAGNNCAIWTQFCNFTTEAGSHISYVDGFQLLHFDDLDNNNYSHEVLLNGTISDCNTGDACLLRSWYGQITFGENSVIENCTSNCAGGLIYSNNGSHYTFAGTIRNNTARNGIIYLANQSGGGVIATIEETAHIVDNTGPGVIVNNSSNVTMNGGEISRNSSYGVQVKGKAAWQGVKFIMNGGTIADNGSYGISHTVAGKSLVEINGGTISGNQGVNGRQIYSSGGYAVAEQGDVAGYEYTHVAAGTMSEPRTVYVSAGKVTLSEDYADVNLGRATTDAVNALKDGVAEEHSDWTAVGSSALWVQPSSIEFSFELDPTSSSKKTDLFVAYVQVNSDGSPVEGAKVTIEEVENVDNIPITLKGLTADVPYAVMLFNNKEYTIAPDDVTIYVGGGQGDETYDNGGFPAITISDSVDLRYTGDVTSLEIKGETVEATDEKTMLDQLLENLEATYTHKDGSVVTNDSRAGEYTVTLSWKNGLKNEDVRINGNNVNLEGKGTLIVRDVENTQGATSGDATHELLDQEPTGPVEHAEAIAKTQTSSWGTVYQPSFYLNDDEDREIEDASGIQILDDDLLLEGDDNRQELMEQKAEDYLGAAGDGQTYCYKFHYLDLVDAFNGNAWVSASYGTTVYLPYPEGIDASNAAERGVTVVHYKDLHREYGISGQAEVAEAIAACELETMEVDYDANGIKFDVDREGFSPFAIVWKTQAYTIDASAGTGGTIAPSGSVTVAEGADQAFTITPEQGYEIADVKVDGKSVGAVTSYTFTDVDANHTIEATFKSTSVTPPAVKYYEIGASAGEGGSISPSGAVKVKAGTSQSFSITPAEGYSIHAVYVDGEFCGRVSSYTFANVQADHEISVQFKRGNDPADPGDTGVDQWFDVTNHDAFMHGYDDGTGTFGPDDNMSRAHAAQMFYNMLKDKSYGDVEISFPDVDEDEWYYEAVSVLASRGIIKGDDFTGTFRPADSISRAEFTAMAMRFSKGDYSGENIFVDVSEDAWYYDVVVGSVKYGWISGYQDGSHRFGPSDTLKRAQAATIANRMLGRVADSTWIVENLENDALKLFPDVARDHYAFFDIVEATNSHDYTKDNGYESWTGLK